MLLGYVALAFIGFGARTKKFPISPDEKPVLMNLTPNEAKEMGFHRAMDDSHTLQLPCRTYLYV